MTIITTPALGRDSWQYRAIEATKGNQSQLGAILLAVLGRAPKHPPRFHGLASITSDGFVMCDFTGRDGNYRYSALVCDTSDLVRNFRGLADHLKFSDAERTAMFDEVRKWISLDYRAKTTLF